MLGTIAFLLIAAFVLSLTHLTADAMEKRRGNREIEQAIRDWRKAHPDAPPPHIHLKK